MREKANETERKSEVTDVRVRERVTHNINQTRCKIRENKDI